MPTLLHRPGCNWGNGTWCPLVVHYPVHLQLVHGFCCYDNTVPHAKCQRVLVVALCLVKFYFLNPQIHPMLPWSFCQCHLQLFSSLCGPVRRPPMSLCSRPTPMSISSPNRGLKHSSKTETETDRPWSQHTLGNLIAIHQWSRQTLTETWECNDWGRCSSQQCNCSFDVVCWSSGCWTRLHSTGRSENHRTHRRRMKLEVPIKALNSLKTSNCECIT